jgi:rhodanese-related sulfurtransferase
MKIAHVAAVPLFLLLGASTLPSPAQVAAKDPGPKAVFKELDFQGGTVEAGAQIAHDFIVENTGSSALEITNVQPACGCTVATWDKTIGPGKKGKITATLNTTGFSGPTSKPIAVTTNDPMYASFDLTMRVTVKGSMAKRLTTEQVKESWAQPGTLVLDARSKAEFELSHIQGAVSLPASDFETEFEKLRASVDQAKLVICYCSGPQCNLSESLAQQLVKKGFAPGKLAVYPDGIPAWIRAKNPTATGL